MKVKLHVQSGRKPSRTLTLEGPEAIFGRAHGNAVRIPSNDVSRKHCRLRVCVNKVTIEDLESLNGTFLNEQRVEGTREVHSGDRIQVGPVTFVVDFVGQEEPDAPPPDEQNDLNLIDPDQLEATNEEPALPPAPKKEAPTRKRLPPTGKGKSSTGKPAGKAVSKQPSDDDIELLPLPQEEKPPPPEEDEDDAPISLSGASPRTPAKPTPPATGKKHRAPEKKEDNQMIPLASDGPKEERESVYVDFDQAWKIPDPTEIRGILQGLEEGETIEEEEEQRDKP